jgi:hypothetical protein
MTMQDMVAFSLIQTGAQPLRPSNLPSRKLVKIIHKACGYFCGKLAVEPEDLAS